MRELDATSASFWQQLDELLAWDLGADSDIDVTVAQIIKQVRSRGDDELLALTRKFDDVDVQRMSQLEIDKGELAAAWARLDLPAQQALKPPRIVSDNFICGSARSLGLLPMSWVAN